MFFPADDYGCQLWSLPPNGWGGGEWPWLSLSEGSTLKRWSYTLRLPPWAIVPTAPELHSGPLWALVWVSFKKATLLCLARKHPAARIGLRGCSFSSGSFNIRDHRGLHTDYSSQRLVMLELVNLSKCLAASPCWLNQ